MDFIYSKYERCCITPGYHILTCHNEKGPFGWGKSSIEIQGQRYCDDFVGFEAMRKVLVLDECKYRNLKNHRFFHEYQSNDFNVFMKVYIFLN